MAGPLRGGIFDSCMELGIGTIWRAGARLLVAQGESTFVLVDASGAVAGRFESGSFSDEDDLWRWDHGVVADRFYKRTTIERYRGTDQHKEELLLEGLQPTDDPETRGFATAALASDRVARAAAVSRAEREADARIAALGVPLADGDLGVDLARAQAALIRRVRAYGDALAAALLRTLVIVVRERPSPAVIAAYARACLFACFDDAAAAIPLPPAMDIPLEGTGPLAETLAARARELESAADGQERADALNNARAYTQAAHAALVASRLASATTTIHPP